MLLKKINKIKKKRKIFYIEYFYHSRLWDGGLSSFKIIEQIYYLKNEFRFKIGVQFLAIDRKYDAYLYNKNNKWFSKNMLIFFTLKEIRKISNEINETIKKYTNLFFYLKEEEKIRNVNFKLIIAKNYFDNYLTIRSNENKAVIFNLIIDYNTDYFVGLTLAETDYLFIDKKTEKEFLNFVKKI